MTGPIWGASFIESGKMCLKSPGPSQIAYQSRKSFFRIPRRSGSSTWCWDFSIETVRRQWTVSHQWFLSGLDTKDLKRTLIKITCSHQGVYLFLSCFTLAFFKLFFCSSATLSKIILSQISAQLSDTWIFFFPICKIMTAVG